MASKPKFEKYGLFWDDGTSPLEIEFYFIRRGGEMTYCKRTHGLGLFHHYQEAAKLLWPKQDQHRWNSLTLQEILANAITGIIGPASSGKTHGASKYALIDYWAFPNNTLILVSSTDVRGLELRVWGTIKDLFNQARELHPDLPGQVLDSLHTITTDNIEKGDNKARTLKKGIICVPCLSSGRYVGLGKYVGIKQSRLRLIADEAQLMGPGFLDSISNLASNPGFKAVILGNPIDPLDPLGLACEPIGGWGSMPEPVKTTVWKTRFMDGKCVNLVGTDSPNFDYPQDQPPKYPYMINQRRLDEIAAFWTKDSQQYYSQGVGVMKTGLLTKRVITRTMCEQHHALRKAEWMDTERTLVYAIDAAYSGVGGDRCVGGWIEFGKAAHGGTIVRINPPKIIPIVINVGKEPEDQIAEYVQLDILPIGISPKHVFYDSTGRGTLGSAFARKFGEETPVPIEFGGKPSVRPVRHDLFVSENGHDRLKRCDEHYFDFVTELWFSVRYCIESEQLRELPEDVMREGCAREYGRSKGNKFFVESKHDPKARERMVRSPDLFDWLATAIEGARRLGFQIRRLGTHFTENSSDDDFWQKEHEEYREEIQSHMLIHN